MKPSADSNVTTIETRFAYFFAERKIPFAVSDHLSKLMRGMMAEAVKCPDVATKFSCGRTKTTRIIKSAIAPVLDSNVTALCKVYRSIVSIAATLCMTCCNVLGGCLFMPGERQNIFCRYGKIH